jgi:hypothetical protein
MLKQEVVQPDCDDAIRLINIDDLSDSDIEYSPVQIDTKGEAIRTYNNMVEGYKLFVKSIMDNKNISDEEKHNFVIQLIDQLSVANHALISESLMYNVINYNEKISRDQYLDMIKALKDLKAYASVHI